MTTLSEHTPAEAVAKAALEYLEAMADLDTPTCAGGFDVTPGLTARIDGGIRANRSMRLERAHWNLDRLARAYRESKR
jgi:hypothetical protein